MNKEEAEIFVGLLERITAIVGIVGSFTAEEWAVLTKAREEIEKSAAGGELTQQNKVAVERIGMLEALRENLTEAGEAWPEEKTPAAETEASST